MKNHPRPIRPVAGCLALAAGLLLAGCNQDSQRNFQIPPGYYPNASNSSFWFGEVAGNFSYVEYYPDTADVRPRGIISPADLRLFSESGLVRDPRAIGRPATPPLLYIAGGAGNYVAVLDTNAKTIASIPTGVNTKCVAITPDLSFVYATNYDAASVSVIDASSNTVAVTIALPSGSKPYGIALSPDGRRAYVANSVDSGTLIVLDTASRSVLTSIPVGKTPVRIAVSPDGTLAYVANNGDNTISVIDTLTNVVDTTLVGVQKPFQILFNPSGTLAYVSSATNNGTVVVIDTSSYNVVTSIPVGDTPGDLALSRDGRFLHVANWRSSFISRIEVRTNQPVTQVPLDFGAATGAGWIVNVP